MLAGHVGASLLIRRVAPGVRLSVLVAAALFADALLWVLILAGIERLDPLPQGPVLLGEIHYHFPWSHGLAASLLWTFMAMGLIRAGGGSPRAAGCVALAVFSHFILDALVHAPEPMLHGVGTPALGLGLWQHPLMAAVVEAGMALAGLRVYLRHRTLARGRAITLVLLVAMTTVLSLSGLFHRSALPAPEVLALTSLMFIGAWVGAAAWIERRPAA